MKKVIIILFILTLIGVLGLEIATFCKMLDVKESVPTIQIK